MLDEEEEIPSFLSMLIPALILFMFGLGWFLATLTH